MINLGLETQEDGHAKKLEPTMVSVESVGRLVAGRLPMYDDVLLNVEGEKIFVSYFFR